MDARGNVGARADGRLRILLFGTFYPLSDFAGNSTTPLAIGLAELEFVREVRVFCQAGSRLPSASLPDGIHLEQSWVHDRIVTLVGTLGRILRASRTFDVILFNTYVTAFGATRISNAVGLLLPVALSKLTQKRVVVYMHNFVETQDVERLGYSPGYIERTVVGFLERVLLKNTSVVVPLESQAQSVSAKFGIRPRVLFIPFLEAYLTAREEGSSSQPWGPEAPHSPLRVLFFGAWGPQKDLAGALEVLGRMEQQGLSMSVTVAGAANRHFPGLSVNDFIGDGARVPSKIQIVGYVPDSDLLRLIRDSDVVLLPYRATGGYSGAMNLAGFVGGAILAYDHIQLREQAQMLGLPVKFVEANRLEQGLRDLLRDWKVWVAGSNGGPNEKAEAARRKFKSLGRLLLELSASAA